MYIYTGMYAFRYSAEKHLLLKQLFSWSCKFTEHSQPVARDR